MSEEVLDFSSNFKKDVKPKSYTELKSNVDKENVVNSLKTRIEVCICEVVSIVEAYQLLFFNQSNFIYY